MLVPGAEMAIVHGLVMVDRLGLPSGSKRIPGETARERLAVGGTTALSRRRDRRGAGSVPPRASRM